MRLYVQNGSTSGGISMPAFPSMSQTTSTTSPRSLRVDALGGSHPRVGERPIGITSAAIESYRERSLPPTETAPENVTIAE